MGLRLGKEFKNKTKQTRDLGKREFGPGISDDSRLNIITRAEYKLSGFIRCGDLKRQASTL